MTKKFSPSRERSELSMLFLSAFYPQPTTHNLPRFLKPAKRNWRDLENLRSEVRGERLEEREDLDLLTSYLIPLTSVPPG